MSDNSSGVNDTTSPSQVTFTDRLIDYGYQLALYRLGVIHEEPVKPQRATPSSKGLFVPRKRGVERWGKVNAKEWQESIMPTHSLHVEFFLDKLEPAVDLSNGINHKTIETLETHEKPVVVRVSCDDPFGLEDVQVSA